MLSLPGPSDPERGELSLGRFAVGGPTSNRLSAILVGKYNEWTMQENNSRISPTCRRSARNTTVTSPNVERKKAI